jgi:hypothetical protein
MGVWKENKIQNQLEIESGQFNYKMQLISQNKTTSWIVENFNGNFTQIYIFPSTISPNGKYFFSSRTNCIFSHAWEKLIIPD